MRKSFIFVWEAPTDDLRHHYTKTENINTLIIMCPAIQNFWGLKKKKPSFK